MRYANIPSFVCRVVVVAVVQRFAAARRASRRPRATSRALTGRTLKGAAKPKKHKRTQLGTPRGNTQPKTTICANSLRARVLTSRALRVRWMPTSQQPSQLQGVTPMSTRKNINVLFVRAIVDARSWRFPAARNATRFVNTTLASLFVCVRACVCITLPPWVCGASC